MYRADETIAILHVDDAPDFSEMVADFLERVDERFRIETAPSAEQGMALLEETEIDCIVSDFQMPVTDGIEFLKRVRADYPGLPFILYTGKGSEEVASEAITAGVTDYLQKDPGTEQYEILANRIRNAVEAYRASQEVQRSEERLREVIDQIPHLVYVVDEEETLLLVNDAYAAFHDATVDELEGSPVGEVLEGGFYERFRADLQRVIEAGEGVEAAGVVYRDEAGESHTFDSELVPFDTAGSPERAALGIAVDVTQAKERERRLRRYETLVESMNDGVIMFNEDAEFVFVNEVASGPYPREEWIGRHISTLTELTAMGEDFVDKHEAAIDRILSGETREETLTATFIPANSDSPRTVEMRLSGVYDDDGETTGVVGNTRPVTERVERERELERRNEQLEEFARVASHDLRSPVNVARGQIELASRDRDSEHLEKADRALDRLDSLISDLVSMARTGERSHELVSLDLADLAESCWETVETADADVDVESTREIIADRSQTAELLQNLFRNAIEHGGDDVVITVGDLENGFYLEDDGPGIPEADRQHVFDLGHSSKSDGSGYGLVIVERITKAHDWTVTLTEGDDGGARFEFTGVERPGDS